MTTEQFGVHLLFDAYGCDPVILANAVALQELLVDITDSMGMRRINEPVVVEVGANDKKDPGGCSGFVMIAESHLSFHTFPARKFVTADVYTCQNDLDADKLTRLLKEHFRTDTADVQIIPRGVHYPSNNLTE